MKKQVIGLNPKYSKHVSAIGILVILTLFLPFVQVKEESFQLTGIRLIIQAIGFQTSRIQVLFILLPAFLVLISSVIFLLFRTTFAAKAVCIAFVLQLTGCVVTIFTIAKYMDKISIVPVKFLIRHLNYGFYLFLLLGFIGLIAAMKCIKLSPGYIALVIMSIIWLFPIAWVIMISFREEAGSFSSYFLPKSLTLDNYYKLLTETDQFQYIRWFFNTLFVAVCTCIISTFIVLSTAFTLSRIRFEGRRLFMNILLVLGMFPGFMSMIAVYYILKGIGVSQSLTALILVYSGGSAMSYYIAKGFFDTIPKSLDEAAYIDGATKWTVFTKITMPLSKPIIIHTVLTTFMVPWADFIFANVIMGDDYKNYTVALGLYTMLNRNNIDTWYTRFAAGAVLVSIPIALLFISLQKYYVEGLSGSVKG